MGHLTADQAAARFGPVLERMWEERRYPITRSAPSITDEELLFRVNEQWGTLQAIEEQQAATDEASRLEAEIDRTKAVSPEAEAQPMKEAARAQARNKQVSEALGNEEILRGLELITLRIRQRKKTT
jgi:hypothetical protein